MAGEDKSYTEAEHIAILSDRLTKETADLTAERDALATEKSELETKLDVAEAAKVAAEQRVGEVEKEFADFKDGIEKEREAAARKGERISKLREGASHLTDDFFQDENRVARIVAMSDEDFQGYLVDMGATSTVAPGSVPRETAMLGDPATTTKPQSAGRSFLLGRYAPKEA